MYIFTNVTCAPLMCAGASRAYAGMSEGAARCSYCSPPDAAAAAAVPVRCGGGGIAASFAPPWRHPHPQRHRCVLPLNLSSMEAVNAQEPLRCNPYTTPISALSVHYAAVMLTFVFRAGRRLYWGDIGYSFIVGKSTKPCLRQFVSKSGLQAVPHGVY